MSDLLKFMMMIIALAFLSFLNSRPVPETSQRKHSVAISADSKIPV